MNIECPICCIDFLAHSTSAVRPVVGNCGHTICSTCRDVISGMSFKCPICQEINSFQRERQNFALIEVIEQVQMAEGRKIYEFKVPSKQQSLKAIRTYAEVVKSGYSKGNSSSGSINGFLLEFGRKSKKKEKSKEPQGKLRRKRFGQKVYSDKKKNFCPPVPQARSSVRVDYIPQHWTADDLTALFSTCGAIKKSDVEYNKKGNSKGYGYVYFLDEWAADIAVCELHGTEICNKIISVKEDTNKDDGGWQETKKKTSTKEKAKIRRKGHL